MHESERITHYRTLLAGRMATIRGQLDLSQTDVATATDTSQNIVFRLENDLRVGFEGFFKVLLFYVEERGINPEWLFVIDQTEVPLFRQDGRRTRGRMALLRGFVEALAAFDS